MSTNQITQFKGEPHMNIYDVSQTPEFGHLSAKQANWVLAYCQGYLDNGTADPLAVTLASYKCASPEIARIFSYQLLLNPKIILVLNRFFGNSPEQSFLEQVERACYKKKLTVAQVDALKLYGELRGWTGRRKHAIEDEPETEDSQSTAPVSPTNFFVGQRVTERDGDGKLHTGIVRALDATGSPSQIEEVHE